MTARDIIILGAGPCGLSAAIALGKTAALNPEAPGLRITLIEVRSELKTIGGTLNVTPLAMRYLDSLGAGAKLRQKAINLDDGIDYISLRTGRRIANFWGGIGAMRVKRYSLVDALLETVVEEHANRVQILWGRRVAKVSQSEDRDRVMLDFDDGSTLQGDVLLGCDGIHSVARSLWVDPGHKTLYTGRVVAMGWGENNDRSSPAIRLSTGESGLRDTSVVTAPLGKLLISYFEPSRTQIYLNHLGTMQEPEGDAHDGWRLAGRDKVNFKKDIMQCYAGGQVKGLHDLITGCEDWNVYPLYVLPHVGQWHRGRVLLMGDAVHAMPPQGESTGLAIEDAVLLARIFERRETRSVERLFLDFEAVRKSTIEQYHKEAMWAMRNGFAQRSWFMAIALEWLTWVYLLYKRWVQAEHFAGDVREIVLPS